MKEKDQQYQYLSVNVKPWRPSPLLHSVEDGREFHQEIEAFFEKSYQDLGYSSSIEAALSFIEKTHTLSLSKEDVHGFINTRYGWGHWPEDPWGSQDSFEGWLNAELRMISMLAIPCRSANQQLLVWAINGTKGRYYLYDMLVTKAIREFVSLKTITEHYNKYKELFQESEAIESPPANAAELKEQYNRLLFDQWGNGAGIYASVNQYSTEQRFNYPETPVPEMFIINHIVYPFPLEYMSSYLHSITPYRAYAQTIYWIIVGNLAYRESKIDDPISVAYGRYCQSKEETIQEWERKMANPEPYSPPTDDEAFERLSDVLSEALANEAKKYRGKLRETEEPEDGSVLAEGFPEAQESLYKRVEELTKSDLFLDTDIFAAFKGELKPMLMRAVKNDITDLLRRENGQQRKAQKEALRLDQEIEGSDGCITLGDTLEMADSHQEQFELKDTIVSILEKARLSKRERFVVDLRLEGRSDAEIARRFTDEFGKETAEQNIRQHYSRGLKKIDAAIKAMPSDLKEDVMSLLNR